MNNFHGAVKHRVVDALPGEVAVRPNALPGLLIGRWDRLENITTVQAPCSQPYPLLAAWGDLNL